MVLRRITGWLGSPGVVVQLGAPPAPGDVTAPVKVSASSPANGLTLTIQYDETLDAASTPSAGAFSLAGTSSTVSSVLVSGSTVVLTLNAAVLQSATVTLSYTPGGSPIQDAAGNDAAALVASSVTNNSTVVGSGTDYAALAVSNSLTVIGYFRADLGVTGTSGTGKASWANQSGAMSAITPHGGATNGIGSVGAGLNSKASLIQNGVNQKGLMTAPTLAAAGTTNIHKYWIGRQIAGSGTPRGILQETGGRWMSTLTHLWA